MPSKSTRRQVFERIGWAIAVLLLGRAVWIAAVEVRAEEATFSWGPALLALASLVGVFLFTVYTWRCLLADLGVTLRFSQTVQMWSFSNLGRYLPGKIWQVVGMVIIAKDFGVPTGLSTAAAFISFGFMVCSGALVGMLFLAGQPVDPQWLLPVGWAIAAGILLPILWPRLIPWILNRIPASFGVTPIEGISRIALIRFALLQCLVWVGHGVSFYLFAGAFGETAATEFPRYAGAYALAYVFGLIALFAPGGIGVREGALGILLGAVQSGADTVHTLAVAARLWAITAEILVLGVAVALRARGGKDP